MKRNKSVFFLCNAVLCSLLLAMSACKNSTSKLGEKLSDSEMEQLVEELTAACPITYEIGTATNFKCEGKTVVIDYTIDEEQLSFEKMDKQDIYTAWRMLYLDCCSDNDKALIKSIVLSGYDVKCVFTGSRTHHKVALDVTNKQLETNKPLTQEETINCDLTITQAMLPMQLDASTEMVDIVLDKESLTYVYNIKEDNFDFSMLEKDPAFRENLANSISQQFASNSSTGELFKKLCLSGRGLCYRYTGTKSGKTTNISFSNTQLRQMANANGVN
mgnify:CR=1 FL=1